MAHEAVFKVIAAPKQPERRMFQFGAFMRVPLNATNDRPVRRGAFFRERLMDSEFQSILGVARGFGDGNLPIPPRDLVGNGTCKASMIAKAVIAEEKVIERDAQCVDIMVKVAHAIRKGSSELGQLLERIYGDEGAAGRAMRIDRRIGQKSGFLDGIRDRMLGYHGDLEIRYEFVRRLLRLPDRHLGRFMHEARDVARHDRRMETELESAGGQSGNLKKRREPDFSH